MKLNPFKIDFMKDIFVFHEKNNFIFLKIYMINSTSNLGMITSIANEKMTIFKELHYCINIHYDGKEKTCYFSVNAKWNGDFYKIDAVELLFNQLDATLKDHVKTVPMPCQVLYYLPFHGVDNFVLKIDKNKLYLHDPASKELLQMVGMFEINLQNVEIFPAFFKLIDDLALKMKIKIDVYLLFKNENNRAYMEAFFTFVEKKVHRFNEILEKLNTTNEFNVILKQVEIQKKDIAKIFIKRMIENKPCYTTPDGQQFFSKYLLEAPVPKSEITKTEATLETVPLETGSDGPPLHTSASNASPAISLFPLSNEKITDLSKQFFHAAIMLECSGGTFLDPEQLVFDDGARILAVVHALSINGLYHVIKTHLADRTFKLFFVNRDEMVEFNRRLGPSMENLCEAAPLPDTSDDLPAPQPV